MKHFGCSLLFVGFSLSVYAQDLKQANEFIENFQYEKALEVLAAVSDSTDIRIFLQSGYCHSRLGHHNAAIESYIYALKLDSLNRVALNQLGQMYSRNNRFTQAIDCYRKLIRIDSTNSFYYKQYGALMAQTGVADSIAAGLYAKALSLNPRDMEASAALGNLFLQAEDYEHLDTLVDKALAQDSLQAGILLLKAKSESAQHKYKNVIATVERILRWHDTQPIHVRLMGISYFQLNNYPKTLQCMNYLLENGVKSEWIYYYLGVSYREMKDIPKSIEAMNKAVEEGISENIGTYYSQLARSYEENKDFKNAIYYYQAAYEKSKSKILLYHLARNYDIYFKDKSTAISYYKRYLATDDTIRLAREYSKRRLESLDFSH
ncbi:hypothetical protein WSM22_29340 [Cytophagales bacterium WSM2-2]|nr:hypothetical protein WSM22_29340 [Cytophagales bacterium WSM2-2]